jgi:peptide chain release factor 3
VRTGKNARFSSPFSFLASAKNVVDDAYAGDVIGLYDTGNFKIGDTLTEGKHFNFQGIPSFSPELFRELVNLDPMKTKQLEKGIGQLTDEGVAQLFTHELGNKKVVGVVGDLQFEVIQHRLLHEYKASCRFQPIPCYKACWITSTDKAKLAEFCRLKYQFIYHDKDGNIVFLAESAWNLKISQDNYPEITFHFNTEYKRQEAYRE